MAKNKGFSKRLEPYLTPRNIAVAVAGGAVLLVLLVSLVRRFSQNSQAPITEDQILLQKNGETITINKNGLIEYKSGDTVSYKLWSSDKVSSFFSDIERKARDYLNDPNAPTTNCVTVTLYLDGELVTVCIDEDDEVIQEAYDEFDEPEEDDTISLEDLFGDDDGDDEDAEPTLAPDDISDFFDEPTPTPTPAPTTDFIEDDEDDNPPIKASCLAWEEDIVGERAIISNTLCSIERVEPEE